jgi:hypothetical protein
MGARRYVSLEENVPSPQSTQFIEVSGSGSWHGSQWKISSYLARFPVMGPFVQVFLYNRACKKKSQRLRILGLVIEEERYRFALKTLAIVASGSLYRDDASRQIANLGLCPESQRVTLTISVQS